MSGNQVSQEIKEVIKVFIASSVALKAERDGFLHVFDSINKYLKHLKEKILSKDHPSLATSYNNLSLIYKDLGQSERALEFQKKAVDILRQLFPNGHPHLTVMRSNLKKIKKSLE
jgi:tetratricopeptide (TPR) repeat protein